jgi:pimeloyl-ACP methyl ester carboxylesterase
LSALPGGATHDSVDELDRWPRLLDQDPTKASVTQAILPAPADGVEHVMAGRDGSPWLFAEWTPSGQPGLGGAMPDEALRHEPLPIPTSRRSAAATAGFVPRKPVRSWEGDPHERTVHPTAHPQGPGSVSGAPQLPAGFTDTFTSRYVDTGELRQHAVIGGDGPPLLLIHGWPQTWSQSRLVMPTLARDFQVVAVDQRGIGLSDKPENGYDTGTLAGDLVALMDALGHQRFAMVGFDTGMLISYALAADHPDRLDRLVVGEAPLPGISPPTPLILPPQLNDRLWHIAFNQLTEVNEQLVTGREAIFFGAEYAASAGTNKLPDDTVSYYVDRLASNPEALHGSFGGTARSPPPSRRTSSARRGS